MNYSHMGLTDERIPKNEASQVSYCIEIALMGNKRSYWSCIDIWAVGAVAGPKSVRGVAYDHFYYHVPRD